jgi:hypothetical protein
MLPYLLGNESYRKSETISATKAWSEASFLLGYATKGEKDAYISIGKN